MKYKYAEKCFWNCYGTHVTQNCVETSCNMLSTKIKAVVVKIYKDFSVYTMSN